MAEGIDPNKISQEQAEMFAKLKDVFEKGGKSLEDRLKDYAQKNAEYTKLSNKRNIDEKEQQEFTKQLNLRKNNFEKKYISDFIKFDQEQRRLVKNQEITEKERLKNLDSFKNIQLAQIEQLKDPALTKSFKDFTVNIDKSAGRAANFANLFGESGEDLKNRLKETGAALANAGNSIITSYRDTGSQTKLATTILSEGANAGGTMLQGLGAGASAAGQAVSGMGRYGRIAGVALQGIGAAAGLAGGALKEITQKVLPFLSAELDKNIAAFQSMSASGALFGNGLTGMIQTAGTAGMTLDMFNNVVKNNTGSLAALGEGVTAGATRAARALQAGGDGMRKQLLNLGFTIEEQGSLVAETMETMRQSGGRLTASDAEVAEQTKKYAENLRVISSITGEDAKKKMDQVKQENTKLAFQQKIAGMDESQRAAIVRAQANMSDLQRKAFQEMMVFGQVVTPELAATVAQSENLRGSVEDAVAAAQSGTLDEVRMREIQSQRGEGIKQELLSLQGIAQAGMAGVGGLVGGISESLGKELQFRNNFNETSIANAENAARGQRETADALTSSMNDVVRANVEAAKTIQDAILQSGVMTGFATATREATDAMTALIRKFTGENSGGAASAEQQQQNSETTGRAIGSTAGSVIGGAIGSLAGPVGTIVGSIIGEQIGNVAGGFLGRNVGGTAESRIPQAGAPGMGSFGDSTIAQFASGGIANFPKTGAPAILHGREMVLPLPNDLTPENLAETLKGMNESQRQSQLQQMANTELNAFESMNRDMISKSETNISVLSKLTEQMEELLTATRLVVANTERTARGVA